MFESGMKSQKAEISPINQYLIDAVVTRGN